jgi:hypothetical protein
VVKTPRSTNTLKNAVPDGDAPGFDPCEFAAERLSLARFKSSGVANPRETSDRSRMDKGSFPLSPFLDTFESVLVSAGVTNFTPLVVIRGIDKTSRMANVSRGGNSTAPQTKASSNLYHSYIVQLKEMKKHWILLKS